MSISRGHQAFKFKCAASHSFFKTFEEISNQGFASYRRISHSTAASSSDEETNTWQSRKHPDSGAWCPKCESLYKSCQSTARNSDMKLVGKLFSLDLAFKCNKAGHLTKVNFTKRIQGHISCVECKREEREA